MDKLILIYRGSILERNLDKNPKTFAPCYLHSPPLANFTPSYGFLGLEISTATAESTVSWGNNDIKYFVLQTR
jgi:hypothetical protein